MADPNGNGALQRLKGKHAAFVICWLLGNGCLFPWNSMLTIEDYYVYLFPSFLAGLAASGALTCTLRIITKGVFENSKSGLRKGAILFYAISAFYELVSVILYAFVFPKLPIVKYYRAKAATEGSKTVSADLAAAGNQKPTEIRSEGEQIDRLRNRQLLVLNFDYALALFSTYWLSLSIFPGFFAEDTGSHGLGSWYALVLIAMYNVWDLIGRCLPLLRFLKLESRKMIVLVAASRFLLIPCFYFTAKYGGQGWMIMLTSFLGLTNGYLTVCILTSAPKGYKVTALKTIAVRLWWRSSTSPVVPKVNTTDNIVVHSRVMPLEQGSEQNALGNILVLFLLGGIFVGVTSDWLWLIGKGW